MIPISAKSLFMKAIVVGLLFALFACSDDSPEPAPPSAPTPVAQTAQTQAPRPAPTPVAQPAPAQVAQTAQTQAPRPAPTPAQPDIEPAEPIKVAASLNLIEDWVENVGGDRVEATSLMPIGSDPHTFQPGPRAVAEIAEADLALIIGLRLEAHWLGELVKNAARDPSTVVELGDVVDPIEFVEIHDAPADGHDHDDHDHDHDHDHEDGDANHSHDHDHEDGDADHDHESGDADHDHEHEDGADDGHDHEHGPLDPHFWHDPLRVKKVVWDISARLSVLDPSGAETYRSNAEAYNAQLDELHAWIVAQVARIPEERRLLVTSHDSMGYFAEAYGFKVLGVILSTATEAEPSADDIARLSQKVEEYGVPAVFGETTISERLAAAVASEAGATLVKLHSESLSAEGGGAETYIEMIRTNVTLIVEALE